jgi:nucleotide-binding universal stress UspA family protein
VVFTPKLDIILCPTDFSAHSAAGLRVAGGIARAFGGRVVVLHAQRLEAPVYFTKAQTRALKAQLRRSARAAWGYVNDFSTQNLPEGVSHTILLLEEDPVEAVLRVAKELRAGLVVMGTHGRRGLARIRLGSVTESVLRQVSVPALTVGPRIKPSPRLAGIRRILCPVNYSELARAAFEYAAGLAERLGAELIALHVLEHGGHQEDGNPVRKLCDWVPAELRGRCEVKEAVLEGTASEKIVREAQRSHASLIVLGAQPRSFVGTILFGSTSELVIRNALCPVLSVIRK